MSQGVEGNYLEYESSYNPEDEYERLQGARFVIDSSVGEYASRWRALSLLTYFADSTIDPVMASVIKRLLPLATYYTAIQAFVEQYSQLEHGVINHALCAAIKNMLRVCRSHLNFTAHSHNSLFLLGISCAPRDS